MVGALLWNILAWMAWGLMVLGVRYYVERKKQKMIEREALEAIGTL
jgi:heme exporter protein C